MLQDWDLVVAITERERNGMKPDAKSSYSYKICTQSSWPSNQFGKSYYEVWRRYSDFEWLGEMLEKHRSTLIVPPLPGKQLARYFDQKSEEFLNERQQALNKFLKRLAAHPYFSFDRHFKMFITAGPEQFASFMTETTSGGSKLLGSVTTTIKMAANSLRLKNPDPEFAKEAKYFEELEDKLGAVERVASRIHTEREELCSDLEEFSASLVQWSLNEPQLVHYIRRMGSCVDTCDSASKTLNEKNALSLIAASKEYQLYCASGVSAVRRRDGLQLDKEKAGEEREKKKKVHDEAANARKLQKLPKLADDLQKAGVEAERTLDDLSIANEQLRVDIEKWKEAKNKELGKVMSVFADNHIAYHQKCYKEWEGVLGLLRAPSSLFSPPDFLKDEGTCQSLSSPTNGVEGNEGAPTISHTPMYKNVDLERSESPDLFT